jgi:hypothetical protein
VPPPPEIFHLPAAAADLCKKAAAASERSGGGGGGEGTTVSTQRTVWRTPPSLQRLACEKRLFELFFQDVKTIHLPRQALDRHRKC